MNTPVTLPSIDTFIETYSSEGSSSRSHFGNLLKRTFDNSLAPLALTSRMELSWMPLFGKTRRAFITLRLEDFSLRLRHPDETLFERSIQVFRVVEDVPIQALLLTAPSAKLPIHRVEYRACPVVRELSMLEKPVTLGSFLGKDVRAELHDILEEADKPTEGDRFEQSVTQLTERMNYYEREIQ